MTSSAGWSQHDADEDARLRQELAALRSQVEAATAKSLEYHRLYGEQFDRAEELTQGRMAAERELAEYKRQHPHTWRAGGDGDWLCLACNETYEASIKGDQPSGEAGA